MNSTQRKTPTGKSVRFAKRPPTYYEPDATFLPIYTSDVWYTTHELQENLQKDVHATLKAYLQQRDDTRKPVLSFHASHAGPMVGIDKLKGDDCYSRGLEMISPEEVTRKKRCDLYRSLVLKQHHMLRSNQITSKHHAADMLRSFAEKHSQWAKVRGRWLAQEDATEARKVYREAFLSKDGADGGLGICPTPHRYVRRRKRKSSSAQTA